MDNCTIDGHLVSLIVIMILTGSFGGLLNYLFNFDTTENDQKNNVVIYKYILLGIGAALLVPVFLKMISSNLISSKENNDYLIFAGFCLIAAIFSKRFITTIGEKILEAAKKAEKSAQESIQKSETTQLELTSAKERIEDVKLAVDIRNTASSKNVTANVNPAESLMELANSYIEKTNVPEYSSRVKLKAELGRKMGEIIIRNNLPKGDLLKDNQSEGMLLALAYSIELHPLPGDLAILNQISGIALQMYTRYTILRAYDTMARNNFIHQNQVKEIYNLVTGFRDKADASLINKIHETINILSLIDPKTAG